MSDERGFTLVEVLVAFFLLMVGMAGTALMLNTANATTAGTKAREQAVALQRQVIEAARSVPYDQLAPASVVSAVRDNPDLDLGDETEGGSWTITRGGMTYTVTLGACSVDDYRSDGSGDGLGTHDTTTFCATNDAADTTPERCRELLTLVGNGQSPSVAAGPDIDVGRCGLDLDGDATVDGLVEAEAGCQPCGSTADPISDDYKRIVTLVTWERGVGGRYALQSATVPNPGSAVAIGIDTLTRAPVTDPVTTGNSISFTATTPSSRSAKTVLWTLNGAARTGSVSSPWTWTWDLGTVETPRPDGFDGTYIVGARAVDANDIPGPTRSMTVVLNRRRPFAPTGFVAGRNDGAIEFEWTANQERDIEGYRVYRKLADGTATLACDTLGPPPTRATSCRQPAGVDGTYYVVAVDKAAGAPREGDPSPIDGVDVSTDPPAPEPPGNLTATRDAAGAVTLSWPPSPSSEPSSDVEYRIYRDGQAYGDRYDRVAGSATSYTDPQAEPTSTYSITAVNGQLAESTMVGPVSAP
jgi:Tfp pilus assembly protein PilV